jgi:hypothetical protein
MSTVSEYDKGSHHSSSKLHVPPPHYATVIVTRWSNLQVSQFPLLDAVDPFEHGHSQIPIKLSSQLSEREQWKRPLNCVLHRRNCVLQKQKKNLCSTLVPYFWVIICAMEVVQRGTISFMGLLSPPLNIITCME